MNLTHTDVSENDQVSTFLPAVSVPLSTSTVSRIQRVTQMQSGIHDTRHNKGRIVGFIRS